MNSKESRWGIDEYSRYMLDEHGEHLAIEAWPFRRGVTRSLLDRLIARYWIIRWHLGIMRQYGFRKWLKLRTL